jgi:hypothetical protein
VGLYHNGILIDVIGEINNSADWGKDVSLVRSTTSISPNTQFVWDEWIKLTKNDFSHIDNHKPLLDQESNIIERYYSDCNSIVVNNLAANSTFYIDIKADGRTSVNVAKLITYDAPVVSAIDNKMDFNYYTTNNGLYINDIATLSTIKVYTISGVKIYEKRIVGETFIPIDKPNIYILQITNNYRIQTIKVIIR